MKFIAIIRWNEATEQWRVLDGLNKSHLLEMFDCRFVQQIAEKEGLSKDKDGVVKIEISRYGDKD